MCRVGKGLAVFKVPFFVVGSSFLRFLFLCYWLAAVCQDIGWCKNPEKHVEKSGVPMTGGWGCSKAHQKGSKVEGATVDGRNPKQPVEVEVGSLSHYLQGFSTIPGGAGISPINSITSFHLPY